MDVTGKSFNVDGLELRLHTLLDAGIEKHRIEIASIADSADKELEIEMALNEIKERWSLQQFSFTTWKERSTPILHDVLPVTEDLEEAQTSIQTMLALRHVAPFREEAES